MLIRLFIIAALLFSRTPSFASGTCEELILGSAEKISVQGSEFSKAAFNQAFEAEYRDVDGKFERASLVVLRGKMRKEIERSCPTTCSEEQIERLTAHLVSEHLERTEKMLHGARVVKGYAILAGLTVGYAVGAFMVQSHLPTDLKFISSVIPVVTTLVVLNLGAPFFDHLKSVVARGSYRLREGKDFFRRSQNEPGKATVLNRLARDRAMWRVYNEKMTPLEQAESMRVNTALSSVESAFASAIESTLSTDPSKGGIQRGSARLALAAIKLRQFFPEIALDDPDLLRSIRMTYTQYLQAAGAREKVFSLVLKEIEQNEPLYRESAEEARIYRNGIRSWLELPTNE